MKKRPIGIRIDEEKFKAKGLRGFDLVASPDYHFSSARISSTLTHMLDPDQVDARIGWAHFSLSSDAKPDEHASAEEMEAIGKVRDMGLSLGKKKLVFARLDNFFPTRNLLLTHGKSDEWITGGSIKRLGGSGIAEQLLARVLKRASEADIVWVNTPEPRFKGFLEHYGLEPIHEHGSYKYYAVDKKGAAKLLKRLETALRQKGVHED